MVIGGRRKPFFFYVPVYVSCVERLKKSHVPVEGEHIEMLSKKNSGEGT